MMLRKAKEGSGPRSHEAGRNNRRLTAEVLSAGSVVRYGLLRIRAQGTASLGQRLVLWVYQEAAIGRPPSLHLDDGVPCLPQVSEAKALPATSARSPHDPPASDLG